MDEKPANENTPKAASAILPAAVTLILTALWGAYTALIVFEIATTPTS